MSWIMLLQLLIVLGALWVGSRYGSLALKGFAVSVLINSQGAVVVAILPSGHQYGRTDRGCRR